MSYEADLFTLSFKDKSLQDDMSLAHLYSPREDFCLEVDTFTIALHDCKSSDEKPFVLKVTDVSDASNAIRRELHPESPSGVLLGNSDDFFTYQDPQGHHFLWRTK